MTITCNNINDIFIFKMSMNELIKESNNMIYLPKICFSCNDSDNLKLFRCKSCKFVQYCGVSCQITHWKTTHKNLCNQMDIFNYILNLDYNN